MNNLCTRLGIAGMPRRMPVRQKSLRMRNSSMHMHDCERDTCSMAASTQPCVMPAWLLQH